MFLGKILNYKLAPFAALMLSGCVSSPISQPLSEGTYEIIVTGSILASKERYKAKLEDRASEQCPNGYEVLAPMKFNYAPVKNFINGAWVDVPAEKYTMKIQCQ